jgi:hypothetical protein
MPIACLGLATSLLAVVGLARAQTVEVSGSAAAQIDAALDQDSFSDTQAAGPLSGSTAVSTLGPGQSTTSCQSSAEADHGSLRVAIDAAAQGDPALTVTPDGNLGTGSAGAMFEDSVTVAPPHAGLSGATGTARVRVRIAGLVNADSGGALDSISQADYFVRVRFGPRSCINLGTECWDGISGQSRDGGSLGGGKSYEGTLLPAVFETKPLPFLFDQPFVLGVDLGATVQADADEEQFTTIASSDLGNTVEWDGFVEVRDGGGQLVEGYSIDSLTGIDWALPVPEPKHAGSLAIVTLTWIGATARARRNDNAGLRAST